jgi:FixJ family two-component response regulator
MLLDSVREALQRAAANAERKAVATDIEARRSTLTARETEVLTLLMEGHLMRAAVFAEAMNSI